jgi:hypothetical protein
VLPDTWGVDDLALVLQDKRFTADGRIDYTLTANDQLVGTPAIGFWSTACSARRGGHLGNGSGCDC